MQKLHIDSEVNYLQIRNKEVEDEGIEWDGQATDQNQVDRGQGVHLQQRDTRTRNIRLPLLWVYQTDLTWERI